jgi:hypothetical protein
MLEEQIAVRRLVDTRGRAFALAFFPNATEHALACVYHGRPIPEADAKYIKSVLKERLAHDDMSGPVEEEIRRLRAGESREHE